MKRWEGLGDPGCYWWVEIEHDCFTIGEPFTVSLMVRDDDGTALATPTPDEARAMAAALTHYAALADAANARPAVTAAAIDPLPPP